MRTAAAADESTIPQWKYDVFLSFRGEDVRKGIVSHLYDELQKTKVIKTFKDDVGLQAGAAISPCLLRAIEQSRFGIVVLSENYASSSWCLEELKHIINCMEGEDRILPLFYNVDPSHVRKQTGSFGLALSKHEENSTDGQEKMKQWKVALEMVGNHSGWDARNFPSDRELVKRIAEDVCSKILQPSADSEFLETQTSRVNYVTDESREKNYFKVGPYGSHKGGRKFHDGACYSAVKQLVIGYDKTSIEFIKVEYVDMEGTSVWSDKHGSNWSAEEKEKIETVTLNYPDEYLTSIHGTYDDLWFLPTQIASLTFHSNRRTYGPFGDHTNGIGITAFSIEVPGSKIVGLFGRSDNKLGLRAIGAYLKPTPATKLRVRRGPCCYSTAALVLLLCSLLYLSLYCFFPAK